MIKLSPQSAVTCNNIPAQSWLSKYQLSFVQHLRALNNTFSLTPGSMWFSIC